MRADPTNRCLAVVGTAKHAGKTTALNRLIEESPVPPRAIGLCSIGRDGESSDSIHHIDKPSVFCRAGQLVVSARAALDAATADLRFLEVVGPETPMGRLHLARCETDGRVILAGVQSRSVLASVTRALYRRGAASVLVDGAFGRLMAAGAETTDDVVLAVGAVSGDTAEAVADHARLYLRQLLLPAIPAGGHPKNDSAGWRRQLLVEAVAADSVVICGPDSEFEVLETKSALLGLGNQPAGAVDDCRAIAVPGAVTDGVVDHLLDVPGLDATAGEPSPWLLVPDASHLQLSPENWSPLSNAFRIAVGHQPRVRAVAMNPRRPDGSSVETDALRRSLKRTMVQMGCRPRPVWDPRTSQYAPMQRIGTGDSVGDNVFGHTA